MTRVEVSRFFEPVPELRVEARYTFTWTGGELDSITLSQRKDKGDGRMNSQFAEVDDLDLGDVPDGVLADAQAKLEGYAAELAPAVDADADSGSGGSEVEGRAPVPMGSVRDFYEDARVDSLNTVACGEWPAFDGSEWPSQTFLVGRLSQLLDSLTVDDEHVFSGPVRVSLPEFETHDAASGTVIAVETKDGEVAVACPWTGDFEDGGVDDGVGEGEGVDSR